MRYTEDQYQAFLNHLIIEIIEEHNRIGIAADQWKSSFRLITPEFHRESDENGTLIFPTARPSAKKELPANQGGENQIIDSETNPRAETPFYSEEEIESMPKLKDGHFRITPDGYHQVRYRRDGYDIQFTSKRLQTVKDKFREWVRSVNEALRAAVPPKPKKAQGQPFAEFAERYFAAVKSANVEQCTYDTQHRALELHILPKIGALDLRQITPLTCQEVLNGLLSEGKGRTAEMVKCILNEIMRAAVGEKIITENPMNFVKIPRHVRQNGTALTVEEVRRFVAACATSPYRKLFMLYLYTGIRRNELHSVRIEGGFVIVACGKRRKGQRQKYRKIPISPALLPFLPLSASDLAVKNDVLTGNFKKLCPDHHLYDLRHTFTTRCQECGIAKPLVDLWTGHSDNRDMTASVYTHFSEEYQLREIEKLEF